MTTAEISTWVDRLLTHEKRRNGRPPAWLGTSMAGYRRAVMNEDYPCYFGVQAEKAGSTFYSYVAGGRLDMLVDGLDSFIGVLRVSLEPRHNLAVFFEPEPVELGHDGYHDRFWRALRYLAERDREEGGIVPHDDPDHFMWEFSFRGELFFVVGAAPSYKKRRSRNLGPSLVLLFQPRRVFTDSAGYAISNRARREVRNRVRIWDEIGPQPDLGIYGRPDNREWKQYFLPDNQQPVRGRCPLAGGGAKPRRARNA